MSESILLRLRNAAKVERSAVRREYLKALADELAGWTAELVRNPSNEILAGLQSQWAHALRVLAGASAEPTPPRTGSTDAALFGEIAKLAA